MLARFGWLVLLLAATASVSGESEPVPVAPPPPQATPERCVLLILRGNLEKAVKECRPFVSQDDEILKEVVLDAYSARLDNFDRVFPFLNALNRHQQLYGFLLLINEMREYNQTSSPELLELAYKIYSLEPCIEGEQQEQYAEVRQALPAQVAMLFWDDYCVIASHTLPYEFIYVAEAPVTEEGYKRVFTWMHGTGETTALGHWDLDPIYEGGSVRFRLRNRYYEGLYLAQLRGPGAAGRLDYDRRFIYALDGVPNTAKSWELIPDFELCWNCFLIRNVEFGGPEYIYAPADAVYDKDRRSILTGSIHVISPANDVWEFYCGSADQTLSLVPPIAELQGAPAS